jgi:hypothetical protein
MAYILTSKEKKIAWFMQCVESIKNTFFPGIYLVNDAMLVSYFK